MRRISPGQIALFLLLLAFAIGASAATTALTIGQLPLGDFRGVLMLVAGVALLYAYAIAFYRLFLRAFPLLPGEISRGSGQEFIYHVYILFFLMLFYPVLLSRVLPAPLARAMYLALGARLGANTYSQGVILDPPFVQIGANSVVGLSAILVPHVIEGERLAHYPIVIGDHVTIGANAVVLSDVVIGDRSIVAVGAVITKGTRIGAGEVWGGIPAKRLSKERIGRGAGGAGEA